MVGRHRALASVLKRVEKIMFGLSSAAQEVENNNDNHTVSEGAVITAPSE